MKGPRCLNPQRVTWICRPVPVAIPNVRTKLTTQLLSIAHNHHLARACIEEVLTCVFKLAMSMHLTIHPSSANVGKFLFLISFNLSCL